MYFLAKFKKTLSYHHPNQRISSFIDCKARIHEMYLDATEYFISSRALMIAQISAIQMDAESGHLMEITVFDEKN